MAKPPADTPHSDTEGTDRDAHAGKPDGGPALGSGAELGRAEDESKARPDRSDQRR